MTAPDPAWVEAGVAALGIDFVDPLAVEAVIAAVEPLIRADERAALNGKLLTLYMQSGGLLNDLAAAEAVAARLVEVIRVDDLRLRTRNGHIAQARRERDAARAERDYAQATADELADQIAQLTAAGHDLRAEVAALRGVIEDGIEAFRLTKEYVNVPDEHGFVLLPDIEGWSHFDWTEKARAAIALIEEAGQ